MDLKTFAALGVHGVSAFSCLTAQNPREVTAVHAVPPRFLRAQLETVFAELPPKAVKTGMLFNAGLIREFVAFWKSLPARSRPPLVVDPVMVATSGARLLQPAAVQTLIRDLLPLATLATPNLDEAEILVGHPLVSLDDLPAAAVQIRLQYGCAALLKGGHLRRARQATDVFFDGESGLTLSVPRVKGVTTHGTGCAYSSAITGYLALGLALPQAVELAKNHITQSITQSVRIGKHAALNPFWS